MNDTESDIGIIGAAVPRGSTQPVATLLGRCTPVHDNHPCPGRLGQPGLPFEIGSTLITSTDLATT